MPRQMFVNLPVRDLPKSRAFFEALGFSFNPQFSDDKAACLVISEGASYAMLLVEDYFRTFTGKPLSDARRTTEVLVALSCESREEVDRLIEHARKAGATVPRAPVDHGFMYQHGFDDLDGHVWEVFHMAAMPAHQSQAATA